MRKECANQKTNLAKCNCSYTPCSRKGNCCECVDYHRQNRELPACFSPAVPTCRDTDDYTGLYSVPQSGAEQPKYFSADIEKTYDRSYERFAQMINNRNQNRKPQPC